MKKESITGLKRQVKELENRNENLSRQNRSFQKENEELVEANIRLEKIEKESYMYQGVISGMNMILDRFRLDMSVNHKQMSEDEIYSKIQEKRDARFSRRF